MSQHNSFNATGGGGKKNRTVLKRFERIDLLRKRGQWADGQRVVGLKKTKPEEKILSSSVSLLKPLSISAERFFCSKARLSYRSQPSALSESAHQLQPPRIRFSPAAPIQAEKNLALS